MGEPRTYPQGVTSWVETTQPDLQSAQRFYGKLFGWSFETASPPGAAAYVVAKLGGRDAAGLSEGPGGWHTYLAVDDADAVAAQVAKAGGVLLADPADAGPAGRWAVCTDEQGAEFRLWQAGTRKGAQALNEPGAWNFSDLHTPVPENAMAFYTEVFGWQFTDAGFATMIRVPGYGDHLQATSDPDIYERQSGVSAPPGFADAIGWLVQADAPHWHVTFTVADRDRAADLATGLGGEIISTEENEWTRTALVRDPSGATFTASQFTPPT